MALELAPNSLANISGVVSYVPEFFGKKIRLEYTFSAKFKLSAKFK